MKTISFTKTTVPTYNVQVKVDIEDTLSVMQTAGFERMMTVMEVVGSVEAATKQGLDIQLKEGSYQALIAKAKDVALVDSIKITDNTSNSSATIYTRA